MKTIDAARLDEQKSKIRLCMKRFAFRHPFAATFLIFVGIPLLTLLAVAAAVCLIELPLGLMTGWC